MQSFKVSPLEVGEKTGKNHITTADLRVHYNWTENTIKHWLRHNQETGTITRAGRVGLFIQYFIMYG